MPNAPAAANDASKPPLSGGQQRELRKAMSSAEKRMATLKGKVEAKQAEMTEVDPSDYVALSALQDEIAAFREQIEALEMEWLEAAETLGA